jgi:formate dehydrogenase
MYGSEMAILIPDVDHADCFLFLGMNPAVSKMVWLDIVADGWNRIIAAQARGADLIVVDPRETQTTRKANTHVRVKPGQDWALLLAIIKVVFEHSWQHQEDCSCFRRIYYSRNRGGSRYSRLVAALRRSGRADS